MVPMRVYPMDLGMMVPSMDSWKGGSMVLTIVVLKATRKDPQKADSMQLGKTDWLMDA